MPNFKAQHENACKTHIGIAPGALTALVQMTPAQWCLLAAATAGALNQLSLQAQDSSVKACNEDVGPAWAMTVPRGCGADLEYASIGQSPADVSQRQLRSIPLASKDLSVCCRQAESSWMAQNIHAHSVTHALICGAWPAGCPKSALQGEHAPHTSSSEMMHMSWGKHLWPGTPQQGRLCQWTPGS